MPVEELFKNAFSNLTCHVQSGEEFIATFCMGQLLLAVGDSLHFEVANNGSLLFLMISLRF